MGWLLQNISDQSQDKIKFKLLRNQRVKEHLNLSKGSEFKISKKLKENKISNEK